MSQERLIEEQRSLLTAKDREIRRLREENTLLKHVIKQSISYISFKIPTELTLPDEDLPEENPEFWGDRRGSFSEMRSKLLRASVNLIKRTGPVKRKDILEWFARTYPDAYSKVKDPETLPRRLRELVSSGYLMKMGEFYFMGPRLEMMYSG